MITSGILTLMPPDRHISMNQTEEQEKYNQQKTEGNDILENKVENLIEKIHGMDKKLNTLTNLAGDIAAQARE